MSKISQNIIENALKSVIDSDNGKNIVEAGYIQNIVIDDSRVGCILDFGGEDASEKEPVRAAAEDAIKALEGVEVVSVIMTSERAAPQAPTLDQAPKHDPMSKAPPAPTPKTLPGVKSIIAVASGKGGVGKSTTSINLALSLQKLGMSVGVLDLDIFGPSLPKLAGIEGLRPSLSDNDRIIPLQALGLKLLSIGSLMSSDEPIVWRGPRVMSAVHQLLTDVDWGSIDLLVIDLPPGTGDVQLSMVQNVDLNGAVIVSTPQDLALIDARKGLGMFNLTKTPVLGIVENMSTFICPKCGEESHIFGHGGASETAAELDVDFLGEIPLNMDIRALSDAGTPIVAHMPDSPQTKAYMDIAEKLMVKIK